MIATAIAALGVGIAGIGAVTSYQANKKNAEIQEQQQAINAEQAQKQNAANALVRADNAQAIGAQQAVDKINEKQMNLDATRRQREIIRQSTAARAASIATMSATGALGPGSSAMGGVEGAISGREGVNMLGVSQNLQAGEAIFGQHAIMFDAYQKANQDAYVPPALQLPNNSGSMAATGAGLSALGSTLVKSEGLINRVGTYFSTPSSSSGGAASSSVGDASGIGGFY